MSLKTSTNGKVLYYNASTIDLYDAATYKYMRDCARRRRAQASSCFRSEKLGRLEK